MSLRDNRGPALRQFACPDMPIEYSIIGTQNAYEELSFIVS
jgi:hypothetical protein